MALYGKIVNKDYNLKNIFKKERKNMNVSNLLNSDLKTMCAVFFNVTSEDAHGNFIIKSEYRTSKWTDMSLDQNTTSINNNLLNQQTNLDFRTTGVGQHIAIIENDTGITLEDLYNNLYVRIERCRRNDNFREDVLLSCFALRGSYDPTYGYYAVDLYSSNERIYNYRIAVLNLIGDRNINPERGNRNKQLRIRLDDFTSEMQSMEHWNMYKYSKHPDGLSIQN